MLFVDNANVLDPRINFAIEEHLLRNFNSEEDILLFYINEPSIIIGRNQNPLEEINHKYVEANGIHVVRRLSGGGAVYHDHGNLNFSFITDYGKENFNNFKKFTAPIIEFLHRLGVKAELGQRSDILVDGCKISGNAQYLTGKRLVSHGTLLFNSDLSKVAEALRVEPREISSKGVKSVRSRVANITNFFSQPMEIDSFRLGLLESIFGSSKQRRTYCLSDIDWQEIQKLSQDRYNNWEWNFGRSPDFIIHKTKLITHTEVKTKIEVKRGYITEIRFYGDNIDSINLSDVADQLKGVRYDKCDILEVLQGVNHSPHFHGIPTRELVELFY